MSCTHEMKQGSVVTVVTNPTAHCALCRENDLETALQGLVDLVECDREAMNPGTDLYTAVKFAQRVLNRETPSGSEER